MKECEYCHSGLVIAHEERLMAYVQDNQLCVRSWEDDIPTGERSYGVEHTKAVGAKTTKGDINFCPMCGRKL